jgi:hypothetical protein
VRKPEPAPHSKIRALADRFAVLQIAGAFILISLYIIEHRRPDNLATQSGSEITTAISKQKGHQFMAKAQKSERGAKSQAIRDYFSKNPKATVKEAHDAIVASGQKVSQALVAAIKYKDRQTARRRGRKAKALATGQVSLDHLIEAKSFAAKVGGIQAAKAALGGLERLG